MKCFKCKKEFEEKELQLSHDVPKYMGGTDADGRRYLCVKCHDIYERLVFCVAFKSLPRFNQDRVREKIKFWSKRHFEGVGDDTS